MLLSLMSTESQIQAQNSNINENYRPTLLAEGYLSGDIDKIISKNDFKKYFKNINYIKRVDDRTLLLKTSGYLSFPIRIEIDKGHISCSKDFTQVYYSFFGLIKENQPTNEAVEAKFWMISNLKEEDNDVTISIYHVQTNKLLGKKTYSLKDGIDYIYGSELQYIDRDGNQQVVGKNRISKLPIDYSQPMKIAIYDGFGKNYDVVSYYISTFDRMEDAATETFEGNILVPKARKELFCKRSALVSYIAIGIVGRNGDPCAATPIEINR